MINLFRSLQRENQVLTQVIRESIDKETEKAPKPAKSTSRRKPAKSTSMRKPAQSTSMRKPAKSTSIGEAEKERYRRLFVYSPTFSQGAIATNGIPSLQVGLFPQRVSGKTGRTGMAGRAKGDARVHHHHQRGQPM